MNLRKFWIIPNCSFFRKIERGELENLDADLAFITCFIFIAYFIFKNQITVSKLFLQGRTVISLQFVSLQWVIAAKLVLDAL